MNTSMAAYNALVAGEKVRLTFPFESDAKSFRATLRTVHFRQHEVMVACGIADASEPKPTLATTLKYLDDINMWELCMELVAAKVKRNYNIASFSIIPKEDNKECPDQQIS